MTSRGSAVRALLCAVVCGLAVGCSSPAPSDSASDETTPSTGQTTPPVSDADAHGFLAYGDGARCLGTDYAELFMRTGKSALVVCRSEIDRLYYRGYRLSDGAGIDLYDVTRQPDGFVVVNAADNARYVITHDGFQLVQNDVVVADERAVEVGPAPDVRAPETPTASNVVLGSGSAMGPASQGYGSEAPTVVSMGSCASAVSDIVWQDWGAPTAHGEGRGCVQTGPPPQYSVVASNIGMCQGVLAYRTLAISTNQPQDICSG